MIAKYEIWATLLWIYFLGESVFNTSFLFLAFPPPPPSFVSSPSRLMAERNIWGNKIELASGTCSHKNKIGWPGFLELPLFCLYVLILLACVSVCGCWLLWGCVGVSVSVCAQRNHKSDRESRWVRLLKSGYWREIKRKHQSWLCTHVFDCMSESGDVCVCVWIGVCSSFAW